MTAVAILLGVLFLIGWLISFVPREIQEKVIVITSLLGIVLLCTAPLMIIAILFDIKSLEHTLTELGFFKMMVSGIIIVIVMSLFYQSYNNESLDVPDDPDDQVIHFFDDN